MVVESKVIASRNGMLLIEWVDELNLPRRNWITDTDLFVIDRKGDTMMVIGPERGYPYGIEWERYVDLQTTPIDLCRELRKHGIWTTADARSNPESVRNALRCVYGIDVGVVLRLSKQLESSEE